MESPDSLTLILRLALSGLLGGLIGAEREYRAKVAGVRTHILVAVGAALMMVVSRYGFDGQGDPSRVAAQIVSGIGFIGAGSIIVQRHAVHGLTTAVAVAAGLYAIGVAATVLSLIGLEVFGWFFREIRGAAAGEAEKGRDIRKGNGQAS